MDGLGAVSVFQSIRNHYPKWRTVLPLQDGRECPECLSVVVGGTARIHHRDYHTQQREWQEQMVKAMEDIARKAGLTTARQVPRPGLVTMNVHPDLPDDQEDDEE